jgi:hypothetical protein
MHISLLSVQFHLEGCDSLKQKRQRLSGLRDRFGRLPQVAVCESGLQDSWNQAEWSFVVAGDAKIVAKQLSDIENFCQAELDAVVTGIHREQL